MNVFLIGFMGCGKTHSGKVLAIRLGYDFMDLDAVIEKKTGKTVSEIFQTDGEAAFRELESQILREITNNNTVVATGGGTACHHDSMEWMKSNGLTVFLNPPFNIILERLKIEKAKRPLLANLDDKEFSDFTRDLYLHRLKFYEQADVSIEAENEQEIVEIIVETVKMM